MSCISVVRIGPTRVGAGRSNSSRNDDGNAPSAASILKEAILHHFSTSDSDDDGEKKATDITNTTVTATETETDTIGRDQIRVSNRYFTARVSFRDIESSSDCVDVDGGEYQYGKEDGIILVFDGGQFNNPMASASSVSFDSLEKVHDDAEKAEKAGDLLRLCVGVTIGASMSSSAAGTREYEDEYARRVTWCLDHGYEYVEADVSDEGVRGGHDIRDKEGFARIVEAISGTVWSSAVMASSKKRELKQSYARDAASSGLVAAGAAQQGEKKDSVDNEAEKDGEGQYQPPDPSVFPWLRPPSGVVSTGESQEGLTPVSAETDAEFAAREEKARDAILQQSNITDGSAGYLDDKGQENIDPDTAERLRAEREQERYFDNLERGLREAARIREASRSGTMTDEERRQRAGDAAALLMNLMGNMDIDESDEEN